MIEMLATVPFEIEPVAKEPLFLGSANFWFGVAAGILLTVFVWPILRSVMNKITRS